MSHSDKLKVLLENKEILCNVKINKLKQKMKRIKMVSVTISVISILSLSIMASTLLTPYPLAISILSSISAALTGIDCRFKFQNEASEKQQLIDKLNKIHHKLEYVNSKNGDLTDEEYQSICNEFTVSVL